MEVNKLKIKSRITLGFRRVLIVIMSLTLTVGFMPASAFAAGDEATGQEDYATLMESVNITNEDALKLSKSLVASAIKGDPQQAAQTVLTWASGELIDSMFGNVGDKNEATLNDVLSAIDKLDTAISELQTTVDSQQLDGILNDLKPLLSNQASYDVYAALRDIDSDQANENITEAQAKRLVQSELITSLHNGELDNVASYASIADQSSFDRFAEVLWSTMMDTYQVTISGRTRDMTLMQVWYEHLRYKYHWEHQAFDEWAAFQSQCVTLLATTLALEKASLQTRIELINQWNQEHPTQEHSPGSCINRLKTVQNHINQMAGYRGQGVNGEDVNYPGIFSESTWNQTYWMCKVRDDSERYYWTPGHEVLFFAQVNTQDVPPEHDNAGLSESSTNYGISVRWYETLQWYVTVKPNHWKNFLHYSGPGSNNSNLVSEDQLKDMYKDYDNYDTSRYSSHPHLYDIFMNPKDGNFKGLEEGSVKSWWFVVDPDSNHEVYFKKATGATAGTTRCFVLSSNKASHDTATLENYTYSTAWRNKSRHFIGIGVKRYGPETYPYGAVMPSAVQQHHTGMDSDSALWWPSCGDLTIGYDSETLGGVVSAEIDGVKIDPSNYSVIGDDFVLSKTYMSGLDFDKHKLELACEHGSHTVKFGVKQKQNIAVKSTIKKTYGNKDFNLGAAADGEGGLTYKSSNKKVVIIDADGDAVIRGAGTAKITVSAAETEEYAPAARTVTVNVAKAANPLSIKAKTATVKYSTVKKKAQTLAVTKVITFTKKLNDKKSYTLSSAKKGKKSFKKYFNINKKTGKVTVKKGLKKGTYKVKVKVRAAGNTNYKTSAWKTVTFKVKVK